MTYNIWIHYEWIDIIASLVCVCKNIAAPTRVCVREGGRERARARAREREMGEGRGRKG